MSQARKFYHKSIPSIVIVIQEDKVTLGCVLCTKILPISIELWKHDSETWQEEWVAVHKECFELLNEVIEQTAGTVLQNRPQG